MLRGQRLEEPRALQKGRVRDAGMDVARCVVIDDIYDIDKLGGLEFDRGVLKPIAGAGTAPRPRSSRAHADVRAASRRSYDNRTPQRTFLLDEFTEGEQSVAHGVVFDSEVLFYALGRYRDPCLTNHHRLVPRHEALNG